MGAIEENAEAIKAAAKKRAQGSREGRRQKKPAEAKQAEEHRSFREKETEGMSLELKDRRWNDRVP